MQRRLISSFVGGILGVAVAWRFQDSFGLPETLAYAASAFAGIAVGYVASTLFDVFSGAGSPETETTPK